jgi:hypothetical protein
MPRKGAHLRYLVGAMTGAFLIAGFGLTLGAIRGLVRRARSLSRLQRAEGVVVAVQTKTMTSTVGRRVKTIRMHFPVIEFSRPGEARETFTSEVGDAGPKAAFTRGERLAVLYDPSGEVVPAIDSWAGLWLAQLLMLAGGLAFVSGAVIIYWAFGGRLWGA